MTVELLHWPDEKGRRRALERSNKFALLLLSSNSPPPESIGPREDWIRLPADNRDIQLRISMLVRRAEPAEPTIDDDGILSNLAGSVAIPEVEAKLLAVLLTQYQRVTDLGTLLSAGWPGQDPSRNLFDVHLHRLRRRIQPLELEIATVRKRGWILRPIQTEA